MSRLLSVSHTKEQVELRIKTETRRLGWWEDKRGRRLVREGDTLTLCEKVMGRGQCRNCEGEPECPHCGYRNDGDRDALAPSCEWCDGQPCACGGTGREPLVKIAEVEVVGVRRERLDAITAEGVAREGFPEWSVAEFVAFFCDTFGVTSDREVTVIEWRYIYWMGRAECGCCVAWSAVEPDEKVGAAVAELGQIVVSWQPRVSREELAAASAETYRFHRARSGDCGRPS